MKALDYYVNWNLDVANYPIIHFKVDEVPDKSSLEYEERKCFYYAEKDGFVSFFWYESPGPGYGGNKFYIMMKNGEAKVLHGPWSGNTFTANSLGFTHCISVIFTTKAVWNENFHGGICGAFTVDWVKNALIELNADIEIVNIGWKYPIDGRLSSEQAMVVYSGFETQEVSPYYIPKLKFNPCKHDLTYRNGKCAICRHVVI